MPLSISHRIGDNWKSCGVIALNVNGCAYVTEPIISPRVGPVFTPCVYCEIGNGRTVDHIVPRSKGGDNSYDNKAFACERCNGLKANQNLLMFLYHRKWSARTVSELIMSPNWSPAPVEESMWATVDYDGG